MRDEFWIERQGKRMVLYAGLIDAAHEAGLSGITTELIQIPTPENGNLAICKAVVTMGDGRLFSGIGDASPENVGRNIVPHITRMSETRGKARALRDALNIGALAAEELGVDEGDSPQPAQKPRGSPQKHNAEQVAGQATRKQLNYLEALIPEAVEGGTPKFEEMVGKKVSELTRDEASQWIKRLSGNAS